MSTVLTISDVHAGVGDKADDLHPSVEAELLRLIPVWREEYDVLVAAGDTLDVSEAHGNVGRIENAHPKLCQMVEDCFDFVLVGNHDNREYLCGHWTLDRLEYQGAIWLHGQELDPYTHGIGGLVGKAAVVAGCCAERLLNKDIDEWILRKLGKGRYGSTDYFREKAKAKYGNLPVIMGHSHKWACLPPYYFNAGCWTGLTPGLPLRYET